ncbi:hypothetical protein HDU87_003165 [Geranomyces variabilis]|uniref:SF3 helicase domain-containing protein n=1 Tax=Geranomyces variabilis TaxID=109894 RepID=A0AAD5XN28_9FUNG|nr:hypothetical protein HDU87_003165 [Geranomyces variabilis]
MSSITLPSKTLPDFDDICGPDDFSNPVTDGNNNEVAKNNADTAENSAVSAGNNGKRKNTETELEQRKKHKQDDGDEDENAQAPEHQLIAELIKEPSNFTLTPEAEEVLDAVKTDLANGKGKADIHELILSFFKEYSTLSDQFLSEKDANRRLTAFQNMVLDLTDIINAKYLYEVSPNTFITRQLTYDLDITASAEDVVMKLLERIFPEEALRIYIIRIIALALIGYQTELIHFFVGLGASGKSTLGALLEAAFGEFHTAFNASVFEKSIDTLKPTPEAIKLRGARVATWNEAETNKDGKAKFINIATTKKMAGGTLLVARDLHKSTIAFMAFAALFGFMNILPAVMESDTGFWRRARVCKCISKFSNDITEEKDGVYFAEHDIKDKINNKRGFYGSGLIGIAIKSLAQMPMKNGNLDFLAIPYPESSRIETAKWREQENGYLHFLKNHCEVRPEAESGIAKEDLLAAFRKHSPAYKGVCDATVYANLMALVDQPACYKYYPSYAEELLGSTGVCEIALPDEFKNIKFIRAGYVTKAERQPGGAQTKARFIKLYLRKN